MTFQSYTNHDFRYAESLGQSDTTSTTYQDKVTLTFTPPTPGDYIIIADAEVQCTSTSSYQSKARLYIGTNTYQELIYSVHDTTDWYPFNALKRLSLSASTTMKIQFCSSSTSATARIRNARLIAFKVSSEYAEDEIRTTATGTSWATKVTLTFTPATAGDYLIIATANIDNSTSYNVKCRLLQDDTTELASVVRRPQASTARYNFGAIRKITLNAMSHNFKIQYCSSSTSGKAGIGYAHVIAIRVDQFPNNYYQESEAESSPSVAGNWYDKVTLTYTPQAGDHLIIGTIHHTSADTANSVGIRLNQDGTIATDRLIEQQATTDYESSFSFTKAYLTATSKTDKMQYMGESTVSKVKMARILSLQLFEQIVEVEFTGDSNTQSWTQLVWTVDSSFTTDSVKITLQLYNYQTGGYPTSGDGYMEDTIGTTDVTKSQTITTNPTNFRNASGNWKIKVKGVKSTITQFDFKADLVEYKTTTYVNTPPSISGLPDLVLNEDASLDDAIDLWNYASDAETPDENLIFTILSVTNPNVGVTIDSNRYIDVHPTSNWYGTSEVTIEVSDGELTDTDSFTITVNPVNDPPVVSDIPNQTILEGGTFATISLDGYVYDVDNADSEITWTYSGNINLMVSISADRVATISAPGDWYGVETINFTATDPGLLSDSDSATFTVTAVNDSPVVSDIPNVTFPEDGSDSSIDLDAYVSDVDNTDAEMTWTFTGNVNINVYIDPATRVVTFTAPANWFGQETITFKATDPGDLWDEDATTVTVTPVNDPPVLAPIEPKTVDEGNTLSFTATASDPEVPPQTLTFSLGEGAPAGATITSGGAFSWTPSEAQGPDSYVIRIIVSDGIDQAYEDITVTVNEVNLPPVLTSIGDKTVSEGVLLEFTVTASDPDIPAQTLAYSASNLPSGATFNSITRVFSWTPTSGQAGVYSGVHFEVFDGYLKDSEDITITVTTPPTYTLTIPSITGGTTDPSPGTYSYTEGTVVSVTAIPGAGYVLDHWVLNGANMGAVNPISITMNSANTLQAVFATAPPPPPPSAVGGYAAPIDVAIGKEASPLASQIGLAFALLTAMAVTILLTKRRSKPLK